MDKNQFNSTIQILRTDNAKKHFSSHLGKYLLEQGIIHQSSCVETPKQNGVLERKNGHLLEVAKSLLLTSSVPKFFWGEAVLASTYLINRMPSKVIRKLHVNSSLNLFQTLTWFLYSWFFIPMKVFDCSAYVHINQFYRSKLDPKSQKCIFLRCSWSQKG